jgi:hypothetical protein
VIQRGNVIGDITTKFGPSDGSTYFVTWKVPRGLKGTMQFCVGSQDRVGNTSSPSCAALTIKRKRRR